MITLVRESHDGTGNSGRLHIICGDSNMSQTSHLLRMVPTELVIAMLEERVSLTSLSVRDPVGTMRVVDADRTGRAKTTLADGRSVCVLDLHEAFLSAVVDFAGRTGRVADPVIRQTLELWGHVLRAGRRDRLDLVRRDVDWIAKFHQLTEARVAHRQRHGTSMPVAEIVKRDYDYSDVRRDRGGYHALDRAGRMTRVVTDDDISAARSRPPQGTRAELRAAFARHASRQVQPDWEEVALLRGDGSTQRICLADPQQTASRSASMALFRLRLTAAAVRR